MMNRFVRTTFADARANAELGFEVWNADGIRVRDEDWMQPLRGQPQNEAFREHIEEIENAEEDLIEEADRIMDDEAYFGSSFTPYLPFIVYLPLFH